MKLRLLNSTHSALSYLSLLAGHECVDAAMADANVAAFVRAYLAKIAPSVPRVEGVDLAQYQRTLVRRFANPYIKDTLARLAQDGSQKFRSTLKDALPFLLAAAYGSSNRAVADDDDMLPPPAHDAMTPTPLALALAAFLRYAAERDDDDSGTAATWTLEDPAAARLRELAHVALLARNDDASERVAYEFLVVLFGEPASVELHDGKAVATSSADAAPLRVALAQDVARAYHELFNDGGTVASSPEDCGSGGRVARTTRAALTSRRTARLARVRAMREALAREEALLTA